MMVTQVIEPMFKMKNGVEKFLSLCALSNSALTYNDVLLVPQFSDLTSRSLVDVTTKLKYRDFAVPIIASNMDTICEAPMAIAMAQAGGFGVIHRYMSDEKQLDQVEEVVEELGPSSPCYIVAVAVGLNTNIEHIKMLVDVGVNTIVIDIAHGHLYRMAKKIQEIKDAKLIATDDLPLEVIAGNVASAEGVRFLYNAGADTVKVGVGPGSVCTTRSVTGHGVPQLYAVAVAKEFTFLSEKLHDLAIIADGGVRTSGDIVKALACGANAVMLGSIFSGADQTPGKCFLNNGTGSLSKIYRGMASRDAQYNFYGNHVDAPEGITKTVPYKGSVLTIMDSLEAGIRSGLSYSGAETIEQLYEKADWVRISSAGLQESLTS